MTIKDPTRNEMESFLAELPGAGEFDDFDREEAIYWFAADYHGGQWSNLYSALSVSPYSPGPLTRGPSEIAEMLYRELESEFADEQR